MSGLEITNTVESSGVADGEHEVDIQQLFATFRGFCTRKGIQLKEVVIEDVEVSKGLLNYVKANLISNIVVGASRGNALTRWMKQDVSSAVTKNAPDFCSVYVIAKTKAIVVRQAQRPAANTAAPPKVPSTPVVFAPHMAQEQMEFDAGLSKPHAIRTSNRSIGMPDPYAAEKGYDFSKTPSRERPRSAPVNMSMESIDIVTPGRASTSHDSMLDDIEGFGRFTPGSIDITAQNLDFTLMNESAKDGNGPRDMEAEMRRLKLELKQTMDMYSTACKEAISAKKKAKELNDWKMEEARRFREARHAEESALAIVEREKAKCRAAIEAAEAAQRLAEMEAQRRRHAEMKARKEAEEKNRALNVLAQNDVRYRKYTIEEIEQATDKFAGSKKIGEGGYGPVYRGYLDHTPVAIKVLRPDAAQGRKQFQQEVEVLCCIRHPNMVLLLGACPEYGCLVYEYMENGSLEDRLLRRGNSKPLSWKKRFCIAAEITTALLFLHQAKPEPLVHRDLKPANILIDRNYVSKISDVGLARLVPPSVADSVTQYHMTSAAGTFCYIDPEYQQTGMLTTKSDIYSLGILLLQIITAKPPMGLTHHVEKAIEKGKFEEMLDPTVPEWPVEEALAFAKIALQCAELRKKDRPDLATVVVPELNRLRDLGNSDDNIMGCQVFAQVPNPRKSPPDSGPSNPSQESTTNSIEGEQSSSPQPSEENPNT
uniref:RING-type E3 ubiquitin transferase n=1 Tax=Kalanchoe fedtschenkoi TaxID=63787 RepID=A0A7N0V0E5_KALFE